MDGPKTIPRKERGDWREEGKPLKPRDGRLEYSVFHLIKMYLIEKLTLSEYLPRKSFKSNNTLQQGLLLNRASDSSFCSCFQETLQGSGLVYTLGSCSFCMSEDRSAT